MLAMPTLRHGQNELAYATRAPAVKVPSTTASLSALSDQAR